MKQSLLIDLDGTLLPMDNDAFTKYYMGLLAHKFERVGYDPETSIKAVWNGVKHMVGNSGEATNEEVFWQSFMTVMGTHMHHCKEALNAILTQFYKEEFQEAIQATTPTSMARKLIDKAHENGYQLILATNPIFPKVAVEQRLRWIQLSLDDFDDVTTYETSHFCKPNPKYYQEILQRNKLHVDDCIMIGNDVQEDVLPSLAIGLDVCLINDYQIGTIDESLGKGKVTSISLASLLESL